jgi:hypothetical protein
LKKVQNKYQPQWMNNDKKREVSICEYADTGDGKKAGV